MKRRKAIITALSALLSPISMATGDHQWPKKKGEGAKLKIKKIPGVTPQEEVFHIDENGDCWETIGTTFVPWNK